MPSPIDRVSIRDHMISMAAGAASFFDAVKAVGVNAIELQIDPDLRTPHVKRADDACFCLNNEMGISDLKDALSEQSIRVSAVLLMTDFSSDDSAEQVLWAIRSAQIAATFGAPAVRVDPLTRNKDLPREKVRDNFITRINQVLDETANTRIDFGIENHGPFGNDPVFLDEIFAAVDDARLGMTLDTGNFYWWGVPLDELDTLLARYAARAKHTHIKNINYPPELANTRRPIGLDYAKYCCPLDEGNIDLRRVVRILDEAGYRRDFCIENETLGKLPQQQRMEVLRRDVEAMQRAVS